MGRVALCCVHPGIAQVIRPTYVHDNEAQGAKRMAQEICTKRGPWASCPGCMLHARADARQRRGPTSNKKDHANSETDSRQPARYQIGESRVGTPRADRKFNVTVDDT